jgi:hypothetical protein
MTQRKIDDLFSHKRSRVHQTRDEFDDLFETNSSIKRRRIDQKPITTDVFDFPSSSSTLKKKRSSTIIIDDENKAIDDLFNNDTRKKLRRPIKTEESSMDLLDMFKTPIHSKTQKKIKMFFDDTDLIALPEQTDTKDYTQIKPVIITGGQWLSKDVETKSTCKTIESSEVPDDERNLMHIQYASLIVDDDIVCSKKSKTKKVLDGKSFQKQLVLSDSSIVRKENLQSCYNALLEDVNKPRKASSKSLDDEEQLDQIDFFDLPTRRKRF